MERIAERHEALAQTVELLVHTQREYHQKNEVLMEQVLESINSLARIAHP